MHTRDIISSAGALSRDTGIDNPRQNFHDAAFAKCLSHPPIEYKQAADHRTGLRYRSTIVCINHAGSDQQTSIHAIWLLA
jgi:hypothetical protein